jgi:hypothetical protein
MSAAAAAGTSPSTEGTALALMRAKHKDVSTKPELLNRLAADLQEIVSGAAGSVASSDIEVTALIALARELSLEGGAIKQLCKPIWRAWAAGSWGVIDESHLYGPFASAQEAFVTIRSYRTPGAPVLSTPFIWCVDGGTKRIG